jgi:hypothetical protein
MRSLCEICKTFRRELGTRKPISKIELSRVYSNIRFSTQIEVCMLGLLWSLELGAWDFSFR